MERGREKGQPGPCREGMIGVCLRQNVTGLIFLLQLIDGDQKINTGHSTAAPQRLHSLDIGTGESRTAAALTATLGSIIICYIPHSWG
ncbi:hypothetical protein PBY51_002987 [Eleginops maclovinus]|uniref:Uncharacterized protein n=1 Tax=Eleginops maclovinus TaxID=56733 RepID=A0AAN7XER5_ELEMC|nr:hypothetical protein PBY51_002987 [Eleginops maclovinus]